MCPQEKADFLQRAEECITDLENRKYPVFIAGKIIDITEVMFSVCSVSRAFQVVR